MKLLLLIVGLATSAHANRAVMENIAATNNAIFVDSNTASVGIGTSTVVPGISLNVAGAAQFGQGVTKSSFSTGGALTLASGAGFSVTGAVSLTTVSSTLTVQGAAFSVGGSGFVVSNGNVGVGTSSPGTKLDVNGGATIRGQETITSSATIIGELGLGMTDPTGSFPLAAKIATGRAIGFTMVGGTQSISGLDTALGSYQGLDIEGSPLLLNSNTSGNILLATLSGKVGINTTAPATLLHLSSGTFTVDGNAAAITNTGSYTGTGPSSNIISASSITTTGGIFGKAATINTTDLVVVGGMVGIGKVPVTYQLDVLTGNGVRFSTSSTSDEGITMAANGNVNIKTVGQGNRFIHFSNSGNTDTYLGIEAASAGGQTFGGSLSSATILGAQGNVPLQLFTNNSARVSVLGGGNVGIGTTVPASNLSVNGNISAGSYSGTAAPANGLIVSGSVGFGIASPNAPVDMVSTNSTLSGNGNLYVRTGNNAQIDVGGQIDMGGFGNVGANDASFAVIAGRKENSTQSNFAGYMQFATPGAGGVPVERMRITSVGNVGINNVNPGSMLDVVGSAQFGSSAVSSFTTSGNLLIASVSSITLTGGGAIKWPDGSVSTSAFSGSSQLIQTTQILTGGNGTYTTPAAVRQIKIRLKGGGGGGGASATNTGAVGSSTTWNTAGSSVSAAGGLGGTPGSVGAAGAGGSVGFGGPTGVWASSSVFRMAGAAGGSGPSSGGLGGSGGGAGGGAAVAANANGSNAVANSGGGGGGGSFSGTNVNGGGGGEGESVELTINAPAATYKWINGAGGTGGSAGSQSGGNGGSGIIVVTEMY